MAQEKIHDKVDLGLRGRPMPQQATELKEREGEMNMSNSRRGEATIALRLTWKESVRLATRCRTPHCRRGCMFNAVGQW